MKYSNKGNILSFLPVLCMCGVLVACSTTKRLADDEVLYTGVRKMKIESVTDEKVPGEIKSAVKDPLNVKPNNPLWSPYIRTPLPIGLWVWNYFYTEEDKGFKAWIYRRLAKQPVLISQVQPDQRTELVEQILQNHGYFGARATHELIEQRNPRKNRVNYFVEVPQKWTFGTLEYPAVVCDVTRMIDTMIATSKIKTGERYDTDTLNAERVRITNMVRNNSYYYFRPDYIEYLADSTREKYNVDIRMLIAQGVPPAALQPYRVGEVSVDFYNPAGGMMDSTMVGPIKLRYQTPLKMRKKVLERSIEIRPGEPIRVDDINRSLNNLTKLGIFRYANLTVTPLDSLKGSDLIDMNFTASFDSPLEAELEVDFSSKSNSFIGPGVIFGIRHKNLFKGGEILSFRFNGSYEWQTGNTRNQVNSSAINSYEVGFTSTLMVPRLLAPKFIARNNRYDRNTTFQLGASVLNRPRFFTMASFNASMAYNFQTSPYSFHNLTLVKVTYNHLLRTTGDFDEVMKKNRALYESFRNQLIPSMSYSYTFDQPWGPHRRDRLIWQSTVTSAGNILSGAYAAFGKKTPRKIFGSQFSQFAKATSEVKHYHRFGMNNTLASRVMVGIGYPYGNSRVLPYSEQFYIGGANSIRAFTIRSIGPGNYRSPDDDPYGYFDQTGEFKLEANVEFRFGIMGNLHGAVFLDMGNIWLLRENEDRPGGKLNFRKMWDQIAVGTGAGLRFDISYLVIRADLGIGLHLPYSTGRGGYYNIPKFKDGLGFHLAIGYPF